MVRKSFSIFSPNSGKRGAAQKKLVDIYTCVACARFTYLWCVVGGGGLVVVESLGVVFGRVAVAPVAFEFEYAFSVCANACHATGCWLVVFPHSDVFHPA